MRTARSLGIVAALIAAALIGGTLIGSTLAHQPRPSSSTSESTNEIGTYCHSFRGHLADALGTDDAGLSDAIRAAVELTIDDAVANGALTPERAALMRQRLERGDFDRCGRPGRHLIGARPHPGFRLDLGTAAAQALGIQPSEMVRQLRSGATLDEIAEAQGVDDGRVSRAVLDAARSDLDAAVDAGRITAERQHAILDRLKAALDSGTWPRGVRRHAGGGG